MNISFLDLINAYRKAKVDAFYETGHLTSVLFAEYEESLFENLETLLEKIINQEKDWFGTEDFVGSHRFVLKKVDFEPKKNKRPDIEFESVPFVYYNTPHFSDR